MKFTIKTFKFLLTTLLLLNAWQAIGQLNPMGTQYFQNQYLGNPAMAGVQKGLELNLGFRKQWAGIPGSPSYQTLTGTYRITDRVGLGLLFNNDKSGIFKQTRASATYAYHLPVNNSGDRLSFGLSLSLMNDRLTDEDINGDPGDVTVNNYDRRSYVDGDFGIAFATDRLNLQAALPNMKTFLKRDQLDNAVNRTTFFSAASYKILKSRGAESVGVEVKTAFRGVKGSENIADLGAALSYANDQLNFFGIYHTTKSATFGFTSNFRTIGVTGIYTTPNAGLSTYTNGSFELGVQLRLLR